MPHSIKRRLFISLGRNGDIINLLPVIQAWKEKHGLQPLLMVAREFAELLEGVSYVDPVIWNGPWQNCVEAEQAARENYPDHDIVNCAVYGFGYSFKRQSINYQREAWRLAGADIPWGSLGLTFDRRDHAREAMLLQNVKRPFVLTAWSGVSTPFNAGPGINQALRQAGLNVWDISELKAVRFFDLVGIMNQAQALVASDSAPLHLAAAIPTLPVIALISDQAHRWQRSEFRKQHYARFWYSEATVRPDLIAQAVQAAIAKQDQPCFAHVYCYTGAVDVETERRMRIARASWETEYAATGRWVPFPVSRDQLKRDSVTACQDEKPAPFYKDVIDLAADQLNADDVIVLTNADVGVTPGFTGWMIDAMRRSRAIWTHRWDSDHRIDQPPISEYEVSRLKWYPGSDAWAFTVAWWHEYRHQYPDMMMGREAGDLILRHLVKNHQGIEIPCAIWHEKHPSFWEHHGKRNTLPGNLQNRVLATEFFYKFGGDWNDGREVRPC